MQAHSFLNLIFENLKKVDAIVPFKVYSPSGTSSIPIDWAKIAINKVFTVQGVSQVSMPNI